VIRTNKTVLWTLAALFAALALLAALVVSCGKKSRPAPAVQNLPAMHESAKLMNYKLAKYLKELDELKKPPEADPRVWALLKEGMRDILYRKYGDKHPSDYPGKDHTENYTRARNLHWEKDGDVYGKLVWEYANDGDYNQNSLVSISDLTPLAIHYGHSVGTDESDEMVDEDDETEHVPPYNGDGLVDIDGDEGHNL